jgi:sodium transport system permease protein
VEELFQFHYDYGLFAIVLFSNVAYSLLAIMVLGRIYNSEAVLFSEGFGSVKLFTKRSEMKENQMPGFGDIVLLLSVVLLFMFYFGTYAQLKWGFGGVVCQQAFILIAPLFYAWYTKADARRLFSVKKPSAAALLGAVMTGIAAFLAATVVGALLVPVFPESADSLTVLDDMMTGQPVAVLILFIALLPAVGEELLFRGFVMGTLREKCRPWVTVCVTALIFAAYHMSLIKMFTIGIIGLGFSFAAYRSGSIFTSMTMHFLNNLFSVLISVYPDRLQRAFPVLFEESLTATQLAGMLLVTVLLAAAGIWLLGRGSENSKKTDGKRSGS